MRGALTLTLNPIFANTLPLPPPHITGVVEAPAAPDASSDAEDEGTFQV